MVDETIPEKAKPKTFREFIDLCNSLPRGRRIVGYAATIGVFVLLAALAAAIYFKVGFFAYLVLAFCLFLCSAHSNYALNVNLTQRKVRRIDYWYLGAATIGMLGAAASYSHQRDAVITKIFMKAHQAAEEPVREKVLSSVADLNKLLCEGTIAKKSKAPCDGLKRLSAEIKPHMPSEQIRSIKARLDNEVMMPYAMLFPRDLLVPSLFSPFSIVAIRLKDWAEFMQEAPSEEVSSRDEDVEMIFGLGQWVIWPFFFAYALALRITKVTTDVFEWAK